MKGGLNIGTFGLERLGHGGEYRDPNYNTTANYFKEFLEFESVGLMNEDDENTFEEWVEKNENSQELVCQKEVVERFGTWMCDVAAKSNGEPLAAGTCLDYYSALIKFSRRMSSLVGQKIRNGIQICATSLKIAV
jgi:hypothetical protein